MEVVPLQPVSVWRALLQAGHAAGWLPGSPLPAGFLQSFLANCYEPHRTFFDGLEHTYGPEFWGPHGLAGRLVTQGQALLEATARITAHCDLDSQVAAILEQSSKLLAGPRPRAYVGPLFFLAPAATLAIDGEPAVTVAPERFAPRIIVPESTKFTYTPDELIEMVPHEACHVARMRALQLPPTPRSLSLLEMVLLEGTALVFTDQLTGRTTLRTFLPPERMAWHEAHDREVILQTMQDFDQVGMPAFLHYFAASAPISGYYVGYSLCRKYLDFYGPGSLPALVTMPSCRVLQDLAGKW